MKLRELFDKELRLERKREKEEQRKIDHMISGTISLVSTAHTSIWSRSIEIDRQTQVSAIKIVINLARADGANEEVCDRLTKFFTDIVANEDNDLKDIRANFDRIIIESQRSRYQYDMILALMRTEPMFRL